MMCAMCESHVNDAVRSVCGVVKVRSSHRTGETVILSGQPPDARALCAAIEARGYRVLSCETAPYQKRTLFGRA